MPREQVSRIPIPEHHVPTFSQIIPRENQHDCILARADISRTVEVFVVPTCRLIDVFLEAVLDYKAHPRKELL